jgi:hypothetical protein
LIVAPFTTGDCGQLGQCLPQFADVLGPHVSGATLPLANWVYDHITSGKDADVICHCEGEIIAGNAISEVKKRLLADGYSPQDASIALNKIHVASYGGASDDSGQFEGIGSWRRVVDANDPVANHWGAANNASAYDVEYHSYQNGYLPKFTPDMYKTDNGSTKWWRQP